MYIIRLCYCYAYVIWKMIFPQRITNKITTIAMKATEINTLTFILEIIMSYFFISSVRNVKYQERNEMKCGKKKSMVKASAQNAKYQRPTLILFCCRFTREDQWLFSRAKCVIKSVWSRMMISSSFSFFFPFLSIPL